MNRITDQISVEVWFTIESPLNHVNQQGLDNGGLVSAASALVDWDLYYFISGAKIIIQWAMTLYPAAGKITDPQWSVTSFEILDVQ